MHRTRHQLGIAIVTASVAIGLLAAPVGAAGGRPFDLALSSAVEVPTPSDQATGTARLTINPGLERVCFDITWQGVAADNIGRTIFAAHIHEAPAGTAGPVVVGLFVGDQASDASGNGSASGCVTSDLSSQELAEIISQPQDYYLNVHSRLNPGGAIRAQLDS